MLDTMNWKCLKVHSLSVRMIFINPRKRCEIHIVHSIALSLFSFSKQCLKQGNNNSRAMSGYSIWIYGQMSQHKIHIKKKLKAARRADVISMIDGLFVATSNKPFLMQGMVLNFKSP